jgi:hypothetical protein
MPDLTPEDQAWLDLLTQQAQGQGSQGFLSQPSRVPGAEFIPFQEGPPAPAAGEGYRSLIPLPFEPLERFKEETVVPAVEFAQERVGAPLAEAYLGMAGFDTSAPLPGGLTLAGTPEELVARSAFKPYAGEGVKSAPGSRVPEARERAGAAAPALETGGEILGLAASAPFTPGAAATAPSVLGRVAIAARTGAVVGGAQALGQRGRSVERGALEGGLVGGLIGLGVEGAKAGFRAGSRLVGKLGGGDVKQLAQESAAIPVSPEAPRRPSYAVLVDTDEGAFAKVVEIGSRDVKARALPLRSVDEVAKAKKVIGDAPVVLHPGFDPRKARGLEVPRDWDTPTGAWADMDLVRDKGGTLRLEKSLDELFEPGTQVSVTKANGKPLQGTIANILPDGQYEVTIPLPRIKPEKLVSTSQAPFAREQAIAERINQPTQAIRVPRHQLAPVKTTPESGVPLGAETRSGPDELTVPQVGRDPRSGAVGPPGGGAGQAPGQPPAFDTGDLVYLDEASPRRTTPYTTVKVLGPGQQGKVMVQVTSDQGSPIVKEVEPGRLTHARTVPPVTGAAVKPPLPVPVPGTISPETLDEFNRTQAILSYAARNPGLGGKVKNFLMAPGLRTGEAQDMARMALGLRAARRIEETGQDNLRAFRAAAGGNFKMLGDFDRDLEKVVLGKAPTSSLQQHGPLWERTKQQVQDMLQERDYLNDKLVSMGYVPEELQSLRAQGDADLYAARMYFSKLLKPGEWAKHAPQKVLIEGQDFLRRQAEKRGVFMTDTEVADEVRKLLGSEDPFQALRASPLGQPFQHLKKLQDLPEPLRNLMGEVHSGIYRLSTSLGVQRSLVSQLSLMEEIAANPQWASTGPQPGFIQLPDLPAYGKARNLFVAPEVAEAVINIPDTLSRAQAIMQSLVGMTKQNIITTSPRAHVRQNIQSLISGVLAGGVDVTRPLRTLSNLRQADQIMRAYNKNPSGSGLAELMQEAKALGAVDVGFGAAEIKGAEKKMLEAVSEAIQSPSTKNLWGLFPKLRAISDKFYDKAGRMYDVPDQFFRLASYLQQREKLIGAGMPLEVARQEAARRVAMSFVSPGNVSEAVNKIRRGAAGAVNPWSTAVLEDIRIAATLPERMQVEPDLKWRLGVTGMVLGLGYGGLKALQHQNGISDEEANAGRAIQPRGTQAFRTAQLPLAWRDEKGRVQYTDLSWLHTGLQLMRGDPQDAMWQRVLAQTLYLPVSGGGFEEPARKLVETSGLVTPQPPPPELREGEAGLMETMRRLNATGLFGPTVIGEAARIGQQTGLWGYQSPNREVLTPLQGASKLMGLPVAPVTVPRTPTEPSPSMRGIAMEDFAESKRLEKQAKSGLREGTPAGLKRHEAAMKKLRALFDKKAERQKVIQEFQRTQGGTR